jgi:hypothetical protein
VHGREGEVENGTEMKLMYTLMRDDHHFRFRNEKGVDC